MNEHTDKNTEHQAKQATKIRPKDVTYQWQELQAIVNGWIKGNE